MKVGLFKFMPDISASVSPALRESRSARRELRDSCHAWNATQLVTYFWVVLYIKCIIPHNEQ